MNVGCETGNSRNKCPICRTKICPEVLPSAKFTIHMNDLVSELKDNRMKLRYYIDLEQDLNSQIDDLNESEAISYRQLKVYKKKLNFERLVSKNRKSIIHKLFRHIKTTYEVVDDYTFLEASDGDLGGDLSTVLNIDPSESAYESDDSSLWVNHEHYLLSPDDLDLISDICGNDSPDTDTYYYGLSDMDLTPDEF